LNVSEEWGKILFRQIEMFYGVAQMKFLNNLKLSNKLIGGFLLISVMMTGIILYNFFNLRTLGEIELTGAERSTSISTIENTRYQALQLYEVIANLQITADFSQAQIDWGVAKTNIEESFNNLNEIVDTPEEIQWLDEASSKYDEIIKYYNGVFLPLLKNANGATEETKKMAIEINGYFKEMNDSLAKISESLKAENTEAIDDFAQVKTQTVTNGFIVGALALVMSLGLGTVISLSLSQPINQLVKISTSLSKGDLVRDLDAKVKSALSRRKDEVGDIAKSFEQVILYMQEMGDTANLVAENDLTMLIVPKSEKDELSLAFSSMIENLNKTISQVAENANALSHASQEMATAANQAGSATSQIAATIQQVAKGTTDQTSAITKTAESVEQMTQAIEGVAQGAQAQSNSVAIVSNATEQINKAINQVTGNAAQVITDSAAAADSARKGSETVEQTLKGMNTIKQKVGASAEKVEEMGFRSTEIGKIVETIEDIASQTNLLALNAAIEAARAGEHGKGFAVVADEVRKLAERSSSATKEISQLINGILSTVNDAVKAMQEGSKEVESGVKTANEAGMALNDILAASEAVNIQANLAGEAAERMKEASEDLISAVDSVSAIVEENTASTEEMSANSSEVAQAIESIASVSEENSAAIEEVSAGTEQMSAQVEEVTAAAHSLSEMAAELQNVVNQFKIKL